MEENKRFQPFTKLKPICLIFFPLSKIKARKGEAVSVLVSHPSLSLPFDYLICALSGGGSLFALSNTLSAGTTGCEGVWNIWCSYLSSFEILHWWSLRSSKLQAWPPSPPRAGQGGPCNRESSEALETGVVQPMCGGPQETTNERKMHSILGSFYSEQNLSYMSSPLTLTIPSEVIHRGPSGGCKLPPELQERHLQHPWLLMFWKSMWKNAYQVQWGRIGLCLTPRYHL